MLKLLYLSGPVPGGHFAAALSYGDLTAAAVGTTTAVCGNQALAFGHPFNLSGPATYGANNANSLSIVNDATRWPPPSRAVGHAPRFGLRWVHP